MQKKRPEGFPHDATPDIHRLCDSRDEPHTPDKGNEIPPIAPSQPHEWKEMRLESGTLGREAM